MSNEEKDGIFSQWMTENDALAERLAPINGDTPRYVDQRDMFRDVGRLVGNLWHGVKPLIVDYRNGGLRAKPGGRMISIGSFKVPAEQFVRIIVRLLNTAVLIGIFILLVMLLHGQVDIGKDGMHIRSSVGATK